MLFKGKYALVTGASGGIGFQIASRMLEEGAAVGAHYNANPAHVERLLSMASPGQCKAFRSELSDPRQVTELWEQFLRWAGSIDILVNCAAEVTRAAPTADPTTEQWERAFRVNVIAPFTLSRVAMSEMRKRRSGRIINISSIGVKFGGGAGTVHYSASKAALEAVTISLAKEGAPDNVLVNAIRAGVVDTSLHGKLGRSDLSDRIKTIPLKRPAEAREIAEAVLFLASPSSSYITGTVLPVSGGE
jgi:NAD(P)-dependent dehydrogenase (short-subunit alcohol dehydrogenase family)